MMKDERFERLKSELLSLNYKDIKLNARMGLLRPDFTRWVSQMNVFAHWIDTGLDIIGYDTYLKQKREYERDENIQYFKAITINGKSRYNDIGFINVYATRLVDDFRADFDIDDLADFKRLFKRIIKVYEKAKVLQATFLREREYRFEKRAEIIEEIKRIEYKSGYGSGCYNVCFSLQEFYDFEEIYLLKDVPKRGTGIYNDWGGDEIEYFRTNDGKESYLTKDFFDDLTHLFYSRKKALELIIKELELSIANVDDKRLNLGKSREMKKIKSINEANRKEANIIAQFKSEMEKTHDDPKKALSNLGRRTDLGIDGTPDKNKTDQIRVILQKYDVIKKKRESK